MEAEIRGRLTDCTSGQGSVRGHSEHDWEPEQCKLFRSSHRNLHNQAFAELFVLAVFLCLGVEGFVCLVKQDFFCLRCLGFAAFTKHMTSKASLSASRAPCSTMYLYRQPTRDLRERLMVPKRENGQTAIGPNSRACVCFF